MSRDWQLDMERCKDFTSMESKSVYIKALEYWLQQYAAENARADQAELLIDNLGGGDRYKYIRHVRKELEDKIAQLAEHIIEVEAREQKLREAIDKAIREYGLWHDEGSAANVMVEILHNAVSSLYPKEETQ